MVFIFIVSCSMFCVARIQVETPGNYGSLEEYFAHYQSPRHSASVPRPLTNGQHGTGTDQLTTSEVGTHTHTTPPHTLTHTGSPSNGSHNTISTILWTSYLCSMETSTFKEKNINIFTTSNWSCVLQRSVLISTSHISSHPLTHTHTHSLSLSLYIVYCTCLLTDHVLRDDIDLDCNPMFYVNINDIDILQDTRYYVACKSPFHHHHSY